MEGLERLLQDWDSCKPDGVVLRAASLGEVIQCIVARADTLSDFEARSRAYRYLAPAETGPPLIVQQLRIDGGHRLGGPHAGPEATVAVVHFLRFWHAMDEVWSQSRPSSGSDSDHEDIVDEVARFRESLLATHDAGSITVGSLIEALVLAKKTSVDPHAWSPLQAVVARTAAAAASGSADGGELDAHEAYMAGRTRDIQNENLPLDAVSMLLLPWLRELVEDYRRGEKSRRIKTVCEALGCEASEACSLLCTGRWNVDTVLRRKQAMAAAADAADSLATQVAASAVTSVADAASASASVVAASPAAPEARTASVDSADSATEFMVVGGEDEAVPEPLPLSPSRTVSKPDAIVEKQLGSAHTGLPVSHADEAEEEDECPICAQPFSTGHGGKGMEQLKTRCCQQGLCTYCAATLATADGGLRCPFCRKTDRHPARPDDESDPVFTNVFEAFGNLGRGAGRFVKELLGAEPVRPRPRPNLRLDVVFPPN